LNQNDDLLLLLKKIVVKICKKLMFEKYLGEKNMFFSLPLLQIEKENIGFWPWLKEFFFF
jgi:hypothetical protein